MKQSSVYETSTPARETEWVNSLSRGLQVLECFSPARSRLLQSQIQAMTGIPKATLYRLLQTLMHLGYLKFDVENKKYYLGPRVLRLGFAVLQSLEVREIGRPYLENLAREFNNGVSLLMLDDTEMLFIERVRVPSRRDFHATVGSRIPAYNSAAGKSVLAFLPAEKLTAFIGRIAGDEKAARYAGRDGKRLLEELIDVRRQGYAINEELVSEGILAAAAPVLSPDGLAYALQIVVFPEKVSVQDLKQLYAPRLAAAAMEISEALGYQPAATIR